MPSLLSLSCVCILLPPVSPPLTDLQAVGLPNTFIYMAFYAPLSKRESLVHFVKRAEVDLCSQSTSTRSCPSTRCLHPACSATGLTKLSFLLHSLNARKAIRSATDTQLSSIPMQRYGQGSVQVLSRGDVKEYDHTRSKVRNPSDPLNIQISTTTMMAYDNEVCSLVRFSWGCCCHLTVMRFSLARGSLRQARPRRLHTTLMTVSKRHRSLSKKHGRIAVVELTADVVNGGRAKRRPSLIFQGRRFVSLQDWGGVPVTFQSRWEKNEGGTFTVCLGSFVCFVCVSDGVLDKRGEVEDNFGPLQYCFPLVCCRRS